MVVTKVFFKALAKRLFQEKPEINWDRNKRVQWESDVRAVADVCQQFNPRFNRRRFYNACENGKCTK